MDSIEIIAKVLSRVPEAVSVFAVIFVVMIFLKHIKESQRLFQNQIDKFNERQEKTADSFLKASENHLLASERHIRAAKQLEEFILERRKREHAVHRGAVNE